MTRICLVRHGATSWTGRRYSGRSDPPLSLLGLQQADAAAERLAGMALRVAEIRTSPQLRARETAERIRARLGCPVVVDDRLRETDFGAAEGLTFDEVDTRWPGLAARIVAGAPAIDWPGGESALAARERAEAVAADLRDRAGDLLVVSHGLTIRALAGLLRQPAPGGDAPSPGGEEPAAPGSLTVISRADRPPTIRTGLAGTQVASPGVR